MLTISLLSVPLIQTVCQNYIVMGTPLVNIRSSPGKDSYIVARAGKGDVFKVVRTQEGWYEIEMFSGERRYVVEEDFVYPLSISEIINRPDMELPSEEKCKSIYRSILIGKQRAKKEAEEIIPSEENKERNSCFTKIKEDEIILEIMTNCGIQPLLYFDLMNRALVNKW